MSKKLPIFALLLGLLWFCLALSPCQKDSAFTIVTSYPALKSYRVPTQFLTINVQFSGSIDQASLAPNSLVLELPDGDAWQTVPGTIALQQTVSPNDTLTFVPETKLEFARKYHFHVSPELKDSQGQPFDGRYPDGNEFVPNIPDDFDESPNNYWGLSVVGYNPDNPEATNPDRPMDIPGTGITEVWKKTIGNPEVIVALLDVGITHYGTGPNRRNFFINRGELPAPNWNGGCVGQLDPYDCDGDGVFTADDYRYDPRWQDYNGNGPDVYDLLYNPAFANGQDDDGNGYIDDISGYDFYRQVRETYGSYRIKNGYHGEWMLESLVDTPNDGWDENDNHLPGVCPNCRLLPLRVGDSLIIDINRWKEAVRYAVAMGARVAISANAAIDYTDEVQQVVSDAAEKGLLIIAVTGDEMSFHRNYPGAFKDVVSVKSIFPAVSNYIESGCTNWGPHLLLSVTSPKCSSEAGVLMTGIAGLVLSRALDLKLPLSGPEMKQLFMKTADDIATACPTVTGGGCQRGWDAHFGYGRVNAARALDALGDPASGQAARIPPVVSITAPRRFALIDPSQQSTLDIIGKISARERGFHYILEYAEGIEPQEYQFRTWFESYSESSLDGLISSIEIDKLGLIDRWDTPQRDLFDHMLTLRLTASYEEGDEVISGEERIIVYLHRDNDADFGLIAGFPIQIGASGESAPLLADIDGDNHPEILLGAADGQVYAFSHDPAQNRWQLHHGFPVPLVDPTTDRPESMIASLAVGDIYHTGEPLIVAANLYGHLYLLSGQGSERPGGAILPGFPVAADPVDNRSADLFGPGRGFWASPVLVDLDRDDDLEIVVGSKDGQLYAWHGLDQDQDGQADRVAGFPVRLISDERAGERMCHSDSSAISVATTVAAGIIDANSSDPDIANYPALIVTSTEMCDDIIDEYNFLDSGRIYAVYHNGNQHSGGPFLPGWPLITPGLFAAGAADQLPPLTSGASTSPVMLNQQGTVSILGGNFAGFPYIINQKSEGPELTLLTTQGNLGAAAHGSIGPLRRGESPSYVVGTAGALGHNEGIAAYRNNVQTWSLANPAEIGDPTNTFAVEDLQFLMNPAIADLDGDDFAEVITGTGGDLLHAFNARHQEPRTWPKLVPEWVIAAPTVGDIDQDSRLELVVITRGGSLMAWNSQGSACYDGHLAAPWPRFHHDRHNSGNFDLDAEPPAAVADLTARPISGQTYEVSLTAPGDDGQCGKVRRYYLKYSTDTNIDLTRPENFAKARLALSFEAVVAAGQKETINISLPEGVASLAIMAEDPAGNLAWPSNMVTILPPAQFGRD